ncbi:hypothetical protein B0H16DRAFT_1481449 [Mycena metata]|uniref:Uncharacterized protein n=1 Tax=Mycena metata TaxID=1033252 RepID=A0AAD7GYN9_9AGAR|nr:hypothetical protein B0H16DRAFT_1481449 [Mycena metata]
MRIWYEQGKVQIRKYLKADSIWLFEEEQSEDGELEGDPKFQASNSGHNPSVHSLWFLNVCSGDFSFVPSRTRSGIYSSRSAISFLCLLRQPPESVNVGIKLSAADSLVFKKLDSCREDLVEAVKHSTQRRRRAKARRFISMYFEGAADAHHPEGDTIYSPIKEEIQNLEGGGSQLLDVAQQAQLNLWCRVLVEVAEQRRVADNINKLSDTLANAVQERCKQGQWRYNQLKTGDYYKYRMVYILLQYELSTISGTQ